MITSSFKLGRRRKTMTKKDYKRHVESVMWVLGEYLGKDWHVYQTKDGLGGEIYHIKNLETDHVSHDHAFYNIDDAIKAFLKLETHREDND